MKTKEKHDEDLMRLRKIEEAYQKFSKILIGEACRLYTSDSHTAEDVVQTTFERVLKYSSDFASFDDTSAFRFLYAIMKHEAFQIHKKQEKEPVSIDNILKEIDLSSVARDRDAEFLHIERMVLREAIRKLPPNYSSILYLHYYYGYKFKEIANILGISENTAIQRNYYIRQKLKNTLIKEGFRDETNR